MNHIKKFNESVNHNSELNNLLDKFKKVKQELNSLHKDYDDMFGKIDNEELEIIGQELKGVQSEFNSIIKRMEYGVESGELIQILNN